MYLSKLEIVGFKSFAQKTLLSFNGGISAVVGPNGCGKTNIVDAIRWVLGEQKTSVLRSDVMENVIFNGTKNRKPLSMAEVTLTIENTKNILPSEYTEVTITRRLFRSGESEYLLNKTKCRLRDIVDLFMDTGLGSDSYSVIELKMVEAILSGRAEERRALFEEAAGIKKYKMRRKETARKLEAVMNDLTRVQDILDEVRKNVNSLSRQAQKTRRYNALMTEFKDLEIQLLDFQFNTLNANNNDILAQINELNRSKIKQEFELSSFEQKLAELKAKFVKIDEDYDLTQESENTLIKNIAEKKRVIAVSSEKLAGIDLSKERTETEIENAQQSLEENSEMLILVQNDIETKYSDKQEFANKHLQSKENRDTQQINLRAVQSSVDSANERVYSLQSAINNYKNQTQRSNDRKQNLERKIQGSFEESHKIQSQIDEIIENLSGSDETKSELHAALDTAEKLLAEEKERQTVLQNQLDALKIQIADKKNQLSSKNSALDYLKSLIDTSETAKFLIKSDSWSSSSEKLQLAEAIAVDDQYRTAIVSVLNFIGDFFLVDTRQEAEQAIKLLKSSNKGRTALITKDFKRKTSKNEEISGEGIIGSVVKLVRCDDTTRDILSVLLGNCIICKDYQTALDLVESGKADSCVSLDGEFIDKSGYIFGGSFGKNDQGKLGKKEKMDNLKKEIAQLTSDIADIQAYFDDIKLELSEIDLPSLNSNVRAAESQIKAFEQKIAQLELRQQALEQSLQLVSESNSRLESEIDDILIDLEKIQIQLDESNQSLEQARSELSSKQKELAAAEQILRESNDNLKTVEIEIARLSSELNSANSEKLRLENQLRLLNSLIARKNEDLLNSDKTKEMLSETIEENSEDLYKMEQEVEIVRNKRDFLHQEKTSFSEQISQNTESIVNIRKQFDQSRESMHLKELKQSEIIAQLNIVKEKLTDDYNVEIETHTASIAEDFQPENARNLINELKTKLSNLGNVNFLALEEFEKESERLNFYENQINDLFSSEKTLKETIEEINRTAEGKFIETFDRIHINFKKLFTTLFGEDGEAELKIDTNNVLETDIEIMAKPPNKRPNSIEQLSGGEKTLTAIALLFAIYLVKPSPFCILDEVDAPLDDANVEKFVKLIKEFSFDTQFLIVSHNKKTMTAADTLYGVTMQEVGVSKTVSVSLTNSDVSF